MKPFNLEEFKARIRANIRRDAQEGIRLNFWHTLFVNTWGI